MNVGEADATRLALLGDHYDPASRMFCGAAGIRPGDRVADVGCGHGGMTRFLAELVGSTGVVYAVDSSAEQLEVARQALADVPQVRFVHARIEDQPLDPGSVNWVYSRFLLMHVTDPAAALTSMRGMLSPAGRLLLEMSDVLALRFLPETDPVAGVWRDWWVQLGHARGTAHDLGNRTPELLRAAGFAVERADRYQPVSFHRDAKLLHALGFEQCAPGYLAETDADAADIDRHRAFLHAALNDPQIGVALFESTYYLARLA